jgi:predicted MPP superfamily phosphohydrolase
MPTLGRIIFLFVFMAGLLTAIEWLAYRLLQRQFVDHSNWLLIRRAWIGVSASVWIVFVVNGIMWPTWRVTHPQLLSVLSVILFLVAIPKLVMAGFEVLEWLRSGASWGVGKATGSSAPISRKSFLTSVGLAVSGATFLSFLYGVTWGKYAYRTERVQVPMKGLPEGLQGLKVVQISDAHLGSFSNTPRPVLEALESINALEADLILFTGDLVNTHANEAEPWIDAFKGLKARFGKFSILGNHDYADYGPFEEHERKASLDRLKEIHAEMGFRLLLNEHERIERDGGALALLGVENWGSGFRKSGDLDRAMQGSGCEALPTILMSHDPTHWEERVMDGKAPIELTLSGHTHGMQFGIEIPWLGVKWSPSKWRYRRWAGLYEENGQFLHVNRGFGVLGFHGRVGMPPEITLLELVRA